MPGAVVSFILSKSKISLWSVKSDKKVQDGGCSDKIHIVNINEVSIYSLRIKD